MTKPVILVVDDDPQVRAAVRRDLRSRYDAHYTVVAASSGDEALAAVRDLKARGGELALLLSDQRMPGMLGVELLTRARDVFPLARRALLTAYSDIEAAIKAINEAGADYYLSKPWHPPEDRLFPVLDDLLDSWQAERPAESTGIRVIGRRWSPHAHALKDLLAANLVPYQWIDVERDPESAALLAAASLSDRDLPAVLLESGEVLEAPAPSDLAARLGMRLEAKYDLYDLAIVGAGPAGLAAAVYGASEGLRTLLLDRHGPGGQAGTSARIENYLGFPTGVSGAELTRRAVLQAQRLGAEIVAPLEVNLLRLDDGYKRLVLSDGREIVARALVVATGMTYRQHPAQGVAALTGAGIYYGAAAGEAPAYTDARVMVVGGGNSAGQCAVHMSRYASEVHLVVRRDSLRHTMSAYLIDQIATIPGIRLRTCAALEAVEGSARLERVTIRAAGQDVSVEPMDAVFVFIGTRPHSEWLPDAVLRDEKGFVLTGRDGAADERFRRSWKPARTPLTLESSVPGVFAAGDVRAGAMNRVAAAVGDGAMSVRLVHEYLALT
jgi:thioredoxin reductase (NADPH)